MSSGFNSKQCYLRVKMQDFNIKYRSILSRAENADPSAGLDEREDRVIEGWNADSDPR